MKYPLSNKELKELGQRPIHPDKINSVDDDFIIFNKMSNEEDNEFFDSCYDYYSSNGLEGYQIAARGFTALVDTDILYRLINNNES